MTTIKNFEGFKKSLLSATNGIMEFSLDDSTMFSGQEYESYRIYVCDSRYFNMFVIHNLSNNTYDVAFETTSTGISTMSRSIKTQKSLIERVVRWIHLNYLNSEIINADSEEYTDKCEKTLETAQHEEIDTSQPHIYIDTDNIKYLMETHSFPSTPTHEPTSKKVRTSSIYGMFGGFPSILDMYNDKCFCCPADRQGNRCCGEKWCKETWKRYEAIIKPEWHNVSLATLANLDIDMLDEKRQTYLTAFRDLQQTLSHLRKCKTQATYDKCIIRYMVRRNYAYAQGKFSNAMYKYIEAHLSMQNVESGVWASDNEISTGFHKSRRYNKNRVDA